MALSIKNAMHFLKSLNLFQFFFHNLSGYDAHLFVTHLNSMGEGNINCIPNTEEKYISFSKSIQDEEEN